MKLHRFSRKIASSLLLSCLLFITTMSNSSATIIETFDTAADVNALLDLDIFNDSIGTDYRSYWLDGNTIGYINNDQGILFDVSGYTNSLSLKDDGLEILSFTFSEVLSTINPANPYQWTWYFYDSANNLLGTESHSLLNDHTNVMTMDLLSLGYSGVNTIRQQGPYGMGYAFIGGIEYQESSSIPAPATLSLFALGLAGIGWARRKA